MNKNGESYLRLWKWFQISKWWISCYKTSISKEVFAYIEKNISYYPWDALKENLMKHSSKSCCYRTIISFLSKFARFSVFIHINLFIFILSLFVIKCWQLEEPLRGKLSTGRGPCRLISEEVAWIDNLISYNSMKWF